MSRQSKPDIQLVGKLAKEESQLSRDLFVSDFDEPSLHDPLNKHKEHLEKKRLRAAGSYLDLRQTFAYLLFGLVKVHGFWQLSLPFFYVVFYLQRI